MFRYRSAQHWIDVFKAYYGPMLKTFAAISSQAQETLANDLVALIAEFNRADDGTVVMPGEYLEVVVTKR